MKFFKMMVLVLVAALGLTACGGGGGGGGTLNPPPSYIPQNVKAIPGANKVTVQWDAVSGATVSSYKVYYGTTSPLTKANATNASNPLSVSPTARTEDVTDLAGGTTYYFGVTSTVNGVESELQSTPATAKPVSIDTPAYVIATPGSYTPQGGSALPQVSLKWGAVANATSYKVYYSTDSGIDISDSTTYNGVANVSSTNYADDITKNSSLSLESLEYYVVTVIVHDSVSGADIESAATDEVAAMPSINPAPAAPAGVRGDTQNQPGGAVIYISWIADPDTTVTDTAVTTNNVTYNLYWWKPGFTKDPNQKISFSQPTANILGLTPNTTSITQIPGQKTIKARITLDQLTGMTPGDLDGGISFAVTAVKAANSSNPESTVSPAVVVYSPAFAEFLLAGKTVTYTDSTGGIVSFVCNNDVAPVLLNGSTVRQGSVTMKSSNLVLPIKGTNVAIPGSGTGTWSVYNGLLLLTLSNGTNIAIDFFASIFGDGVVLVNVWDSDMNSIGNGTMTIQ